MPGAAPSVSLGTRTIVESTCTIRLVRDGAVATTLRENQKGLAEEGIKLLSPVDILEPLSHEELAGLNWKHLYTHVESGETFYTPMDFCETLFVLKKGRVRVYKTAPRPRTDANLRSPCCKAGRCSGS
jgi:hypothetical protein